LEAVPVVYICKVFINCEVCVNRGFV
jgi:hypothetical protein